MEKLPEDNYTVLKYLINFLSKVTILDLELLVTFCIKNVLFIPTHQIIELPNTSSRVTIFAKNVKCETRLLCGYKQTLAHQILVTDTDSYR